MTRETKATVLTDAALDHVTGGLKMADKDGDKHIFGPVIRPFKADGLAEPTSGDKR